MLGLFTELLLTPALPQDKLDLAKAQVSQLSYATDRDESTCTRARRGSPMAAAG